MSMSESRGPQAGSGRRCAATPALSPRQTECLFWVQQGKSSRDIGTILGVSHRMVERHVFRACQRLEVRTRLQAVIRARALGLIGDPPEWQDGDWRDGGWRDRGRRDGD
jgi:LuxR family quorum-sensing system transcriptional regulator CciR